MSKQLQENILSAQKSLELEGFVFTAGEKAVFTRIANGKITYKEAARLLLGDMPIDFDHF